LALLVPACLLQFPVIYEIGHHTLLTGENIFQGLIRLNRSFTFILGFFSSSHRIRYRNWNLFFLLLLSIITGVTVQMNEPGTLILISAVIGFVGTVIYSVALILFNLNCSCGFTPLGEHLRATISSGQL